MLPWRQDSHHLTTRIAAKREMVVCEAGSLQWACLKEEVMAKQVIVYTQAG